MRDQLRNTFDLSGKANLTIEPPVGGGRIKVNSMTIKNYPWQGIYFQGIPIEVEAISGRGYQFKDWSDPSLSPIEKITLTLEGDYTLQAIFDFAPYSANEVVINEINYNSAADFNPEDWIELYNPSQHKMNLSDWHVKDDVPGHDFIFPEGTLINPQGYMVISHNQNFFRSHFPLVEKYIGNLNFGLSSGGDVIRIFDASLNLIDSVRFDDDAHWPGQADGGGSTLELIEPGLDNSLSKNWQASKGHGTPGKLNSTGWSSIQEDQKNSTVPSHAKLYQNYPNPFNGITHIQYEISYAALVQITIYNLIGKEVKTLLDESQPAGVHRISWDGRDHQGKASSSGIYILKMQADSFSQHTKLILMK